MECMPKRISPVIAADPRAPGRSARRKGDSAPRPASLLSRRKPRSALSVPGAAGPPTVARKCACGAGLSPGPSMPSRRTTCRLTPSRESITAMPLASSTSRNSSCRCRKCVQPSTRVSIPLNRSTSAVTRASLCPRVDSGRSLSTNSTRSDAGRLTTLQPLAYRDTRSRRYLPSTVRRVARIPNLFPGEAAAAGLTAGTTPTKGIGNRERRQLQGNHRCGVAGHDDERGVLPLDQEPCRRLHGRDDSRAAACPRRGSSPCQRGTRTGPRAEGRVRGPGTGARRCRNRERRRCYESFPNSASSFFFASPAAPVRRAAWPADGAPVRNAKNVQKLRLSLSVTCSSTLSAQSQCAPGL